MNPILLQTPAAPAAASGARKPDRGLGDGAFAAEIRDAASRAGGAAGDPEGVEPDAQEGGEAPGEAGEMLRAPTPDAAMAALLAALGEGTKPAQADGPKPVSPRAATGGRVLAELNAALAASSAEPDAAMPTEAEGLSEIDLRTALLRGGEADPRVNGRAQMKIAHQETHFEPATRAAVIVEGTDAAAAGRSVLKAPGLLQLLAPLRGDTRQGLAAPAEDADISPAQGGEEVPIAPLARDGGDTRGRRASDRAANAAFVLPTRADDMAGREADAAAPRASASSAASEMLGSSAGAGGLASLSSQVAGRIVDAFGGPVPQQPPGPAAETHLRLRAGGGVLKTLTIQLQPEHLGTLNVSMRLTDGQLTIELAASRAETARLLSEDRGALRSLLEKAGFSVEDTAIAVVNRDSASVAALQPGREAADPSGREPARHPDGQSGGEGRSRQDAQDNRQGAPRPEPVAGSSAPRSGTTFL